MKHVFAIPLSLLTVSLLLSAPARAAYPVAGPMVGDTTSHESRIWLQTDVPARFQIKYWPETESETRARLSPAGQTREDLFLTGTVTLTDLKPGTRYLYQLLVDGQVVKRSYPLRFSTVPELSSQQKDLPDLKFLIGSCYYLDDPLMKTLHISYGSGTGIFQSMARMGGDLMFWLGDNIYFAPFDLSNRYNMNRRYVKQRSVPELQPLLGSMPQLAIWDDHDFGPNNSNQTFTGKEDTKVLFDAYWSNPPNDEKGAEGTFFSKQWGDVEFFATDDRFHRDPDDDPDPKHTFFGPEQLNWLKSRLLASKATFKVIAVGTPVLNRYYIESMMQAPEEHKELMDFLKLHRIPGVLFITGDLHYTMLMKMDRPGDYPLYEFTNSPLTSNPTRSLSAEQTQDSWVVPHTRLMERNFGRLYVHGKQGARVMTLETYTADGKKVWSYDLPQSKLGG